MHAAKPYVREDENGAMRVADTQVMLDSVVIAFEQGHSAETIAQQYPSLTLEDVYGAITYYLANRQEVMRYLERQDAIWNGWREQTARSASPIVQRLRERAIQSEVDAG